MTYNGLLALMNIVEANGNHKRNGDFYVKVDR
jgi:hypothetical protein